MVIVTGGRYDTQVPVDEDEDGVVLHVMMDGFIILLDVGPTKVQHITNSKSVRPIFFVLPFQLSV
jgi:hypothetical protein